MFFKQKPLLAKKRASKVAFHMATVVDAVEEMVRLEMLKLDGNTAIVHRETILAARDQKAWVKNIFLYFRIKERLKEGQTLYIKDMESGNILAQYTNEKALLFI